MFERIHQKLGTAGFVISIIALIAALGGGAYAASSNNSGQATASAKAKQGPRGKQGKPGKTGPAGPAGPAGPQGPAGAAGAKGDVGAAGTNGTNGTNGKSATVTTIAAGGSKCEGRAGAEVKQEGAASGTPVCSGKDGTTGFTETLPAGKTETGTWSVAIPPTKEAFTFSTGISFPIPVAHSGSAFFITAEAVTNEEFGREGNASCTVGEPNCVDTGCRWELNNENAIPKSTAPGTLCIFAEQEEFLEVNLKLLRAPGEPLSENKFGPAGIQITLFKQEGALPNVVTAFGTWAVTAPTS